MLLNLGDLGANIKSHVDEYQSKTKTKLKIGSIGEMKRFIEEYSEFRKLAGNVSKHVALVGELSRIVDKNSLLAVGELEQNMACLESHANDYRMLQEFIGKPSIDIDHKIRLLTLYGLRYERSPQNNLPALISLLQQQHGIDQSRVNNVSCIMRYAGAENRQEDILSNASILSKGKTIFRGVQGVENVYTQHTPWLKEILDACVTSKLKDTLYPFVEGSTRDRPQDIIVFTVGGATYAEAKEVTQFNASNPTVRVALGGTTVHNSGSFIREISDAAVKWTLNTHIAGQYR